MDAVRSLLLVLALAIAPLAFAQDAAVVDAVKKNNVAEVSRLLAGGANPNAKGADGFPVLGMAIVEHHNEIVALLVKAGADVNAGVGGSSMTGLAELAANKEALDLLKQSSARPSSPEFARVALLKMGRNPDRNGFYQAIKENRIETLELYLQIFGAQADLFEGNTPLHVAAFEGALKSAEFLVARGANVNAKNRKGTPVGYFAFSRNRTEVMNFLVSKGAVF
jgi:ankyrin repeat protein